MNYWIIFGINQIAWIAACYCFYRKGYDRRDKELPRKAAKELLLGLQMMKEEAQRGRI